MGRSTRRSSTQQPSIDGDAIVVRVEARPPASTVTAIARPIDLFGTTPDVSASEEWDGTNVFASLVASGADGARETG